LILPSKLKYSREKHLRQLSDAQNITKAPVLNPVIEHKRLLIRELRKSQNYAIIFLKTPCFISKAEYTITFFYNDMRF